MQFVKMLNIGCGSTYHPDWVNLDISSVDPNVLTVNIENGLPFSSEFATVCYCSHVLEHLEKTDARDLIAECFRVLKRGGVIRLVLPDMEALAREYLKTLDAVTSGDTSYEAKYDWIMLELYDQAVRNYSGGEMARYLSRVNEEDRAFVRSRIGMEAEKYCQLNQTMHGKNRLANLLEKISWRGLAKFARESLASIFVLLIAGKKANESFRKGIFRDGGEVHRWMYDRYSLKRLLVQGGFADVRICKADESRIQEFEKYSLDVLDGVVRKPDSIYVEATKP